MPKPLDRDRLRKLLGMLGSGHDGEVLNAARHIDTMMRAAEISWESLIPDDNSPLPAQPGQDIAQLDQLLESEKVSDVLKIRLRDMRQALRRGRLSDADRRLLGILHRKAVIDGAVVEI